MNKEHTYIIIDKSEIYPPIHSTTILKDALYLYLSLIKKYLETYIKISGNLYQSHDAIINKSHINFDHLYVISCKTVPIIKKKYTLNFSDFKLYDTINNTIINSSPLLHNIINSIQILFNNSSECTHQKLVCNSNNGTNDISKRNIVNIPQKHLPKVKIIEQKTSLLGSIIKEIDEESSQHLSKTSEQEQVDVEKLKEYVEKLEKLKIENDDALEKMNKIYNEKTHEYSDCFNDLNDEKRLLRVTKEKLEENMRIFVSDKSIYHKMKDEIANKKLSENTIPILFKYKFPIFILMTNITYIPP